MIAMAKWMLWRAGVPVAGLAVAVAVGWRLSPTIAALVVVCAWLPLFAWCVFAPQIPAAVPIALVLLAVIVTIRWTLPGQPGDRTLLIAWQTLMWYCLPGGLALLVTTWGRRWLGDGPVGGGPSRQPVAAILVAAGILVLGLGSGGAASLGVFGRVGVPSPDELLPLPAGLNAISAAGPDGGNGCDETGSCWIYYRITGAPGESVSALTERVRQHLQEAKGWDGTDSCRPVLRNTEICVHISTDRASTVAHPAVGVELTMSTDD